MAGEEDDRVKKGVIISWSQADVNSAGKTILINPRTLPVTVSR